MKVKMNKATRKAWRAYKSKWTKLVRRKDEELLEHLFRTWYKEEGHKLYLETRKKK